MNHYCQHFPLALLPHEIQHVKNYFMFVFVFCWTRTKLEITVLAVPESKTGEEVERGKSRDEPGETWKLKRARRAESFQAG